MVKKIIAISALLMVLFASSAKAEASLNTYLFYGEGCPHCAKERLFLFNVLKNEYPSLQIYEYEVYNNRSNSLLLQKVGQSLDADIGGVPFLVIGDKYFIGYADSITPSEIKNRVEECLNNSCPDTVANILGLNKEVKETPAKIDINEEQNKINNKEKVISLPILGNVDIYKFSLPFLTVAMGILDGFNPCAMWALLFLISLLLGMENKKRMWILGSAFIVASALVYFVFMVAWLNLILFIGVVIWVRLIIGLIALFGGSYNLKEYFTNPEAGCKITGEEKRQKFFEKLKNITNQKSFYLALGGIIILAFAVNLVELICSAGLPAVYTQVLAINDLAKWQYYLYILFYIFFFMLDDLFVFFVAMITLHMTGITTKYSRWSHLIGGILMLIIGLLLVFKPEWLMFG